MNEFVKREPKNEIVVYQPNETLMHPENSSRIQLGRISSWFAKKGGERFLAG